MSDNRIKYFKLKTTEKTEKVLGLIKSKIEGYDPDPIGEVEVSDKDIEVAASMLQSNKGLYAFINMLYENPEAVKQISANENNLKFLKKIGLIEYTVSNELNQDIDNNEKENPKLEELHEETKNPDEEKDNEELNEEKSPEIDAKKEEIKEDSKEEIKEKEDKEDDTKEVKALDELTSADETKPISEGLRERLIKQVDNMKMPESIKSPIRDAYRKAVYMSQLMNTEYLKNYLVNDENAKKQGVEPDSFGKFHQGILMNTYVDCKAEENSKDLSEHSNDEMNVTYVEFPQMVNEMPNWLKSQVNTELTYYMKYAIDRIINGSNSYDALVLLTPIDDALEQGLKYAENSNSSSLNSNIKKAYIRYISSDSKNRIREEFKIGNQDINITLNTNDIDWSNPRIRKDMIRMLNRSENEADKKNIEQLIKSVSFDYVVTCQSDVDELRDICRDLKGLDVTKDVSIVVQTTDPVLRRELSEQVDSVVGNDSEISNDTYKTENLIDSQMSRAIEAGVGLAIGASMAENMIDPQVVNIARDNNLSKEEKANILNQEASKNEKLMNEVAMYADNPIEYMAALTQEMLEIDEEERAREDYYRELGYDDNNSH